MITNPASSKRLDLQMRRPSSPKPGATSTPTVSVIIPTHNRARLAEGALRSVLTQSYQDFEVIIVDDGSTDDTRQKMFSYKNDKRVHYIYQENRGLAAARNTGIKDSSGQYIALLDDDDLWLPDKLEKQLRFLARNYQIAVVSCDFRVVGMKGNLLPMEWQRPHSRGTLYEDLLYDNVIAGSCSAALIRRACFTDVGLFDENLPALEDQDLWRRIALRHKFGYLNEVLLYIRWNRENMQSDLRRMATAKQLYLEKLRGEVPTSFRHHLPEVSYHTYASIAFSFMGAKLFTETEPFIVGIARLGPRFLLRFIVTLVKAVPKRRHDW